MTYSFSGNSEAGLTTYAVISSATATDAVFDALLAVLPDPDANLLGTGAVTGNNTAGGAGFLNEINPAALAQLRAELVAAKVKCDNATI